MKIWIMRHGEAGFYANSDSERTLTSLGEKMAEKQGEWLGTRLQSEQIRLDKVIVSPYVRAQQTFECLQQGLQAVGFSQPLAKVLETWDEITPSGSQETVLDYLAFLQEEGAKNVLLISHLPLVFDLVSALTLHRESAHFYPAVIAEVQWNGKVGQIQAVEKP